MHPNRPIVALTNGSPHSWIVLNAIIDRFGPITVLTEDQQSRRTLIKRRMRTQGVVTVIGQIGFVILQKLIAGRSRDRITDIVTQFGLSPAPSSSAKIIQVGSVNSTACRAALAELDPGVVLVFGTRIIGHETLAAITVPLINFHSGMNPAYRGQAGGYWALANSDPEHAGVTVHLVDKGVDTGAVLYQEKFIATRRDNFTTYFWLQAAAIRPLAIRAVEDALSAQLRPYQPSMPSRQWYHPTFWFYVWTGLTKGVW